MVQSVKHNSEIDESINSLIGAGSTMDLFDEAPLLLIAALTAKDRCCETLDEAFFTHYAGLTVDFFNYTVDRWVLSLQKLRILTLNALLNRITIANADNVKCQQLTVF